MSPSQKPDRGPVHTAHVFSRLISENAHGIAVYGCSANNRCADTEVRRKGHPSPFALQRAKHAERVGQRASQRAQRGVTA